MIIHATFEDFLLFLYVHISRADSNYDPTEMAVIQEKMNGLYPNKVDFDKKLYLTLREYKDFDKSKLNELFVDTIKHFKVGKDKDKILNDLADIIKADGQVQTAETNALESLKKTIDAYF